MDGYVSFMIFQILIPIQNQREEKSIIFLASAVSQEQLQNQETR